VSWFADGYAEIVDIVKNSAEKSFEITLLNKGRTEYLKHTKLVKIE
jgi:hypothetical protein